MSSHPSKGDLFHQVKVQEEIARDFGFCWEHLDQLIDQARSECEEIQEAWKNNDRTNLQEEIGDLLQAAVSIAVFCDMDPHATLVKSISKFQKRYDAVVSLAQKEGYNNLKNQPFELLIDYWNRAKQLVDVPTKEVDSAPTPSLQDFR